jgi:hypothetical protein
MRIQLEQLSKSCLSAVPKEVNLYSPLRAGTVFPDFGMVVNVCHKISDASINHSSWVKFSKQWNPEAKAGKDGLIKISKKPECQPPETN